VIQLGRFKRRVYTDVKGSYPTAQYQLFVSIQLTYSPPGVYRWKYESFTLPL